MGKNVSKSPNKQKKVVFVGNTDDLVAFATMNIDMPFKRANWIISESNSLKNAKRIPNVDALVVFFDYDLDVDELRTWSPSTYPRVLWLHNPEVDVSPKGVKILKVNVKTFTPEDVFLLAVGILH